MLDLKFIRQNSDLVADAVKVKEIELDLKTLLSLDQKILTAKKTLQQLEEQKNSNAKQVAKISPEQRAEFIAKGRSIAADIEQLKPEIKQLEEQLQQLLWLVPNIPDPNAPIGVSEDDNQEIKCCGTIRTFDFTPLDHVEILEQNNWADLHRIANVAGTRSYTLTNEMVLLEMALLQFAIATMQQAGFTPITIPALAREAAFIGTGHFPAARDQVYNLDQEDLYLTGTSEVVLNSLHSGENLTHENLPILYAGFSPCFRREAGSSGRDTRGLIRVHQFYKVEQFVICRNDQVEAESWHQKLLQLSEQILQDLELPYRIMDVCTGDMGAGKVRQYDLEAWVPSEQQYRETHSCSSLYDWQARRANLRYRDSDGKMKYCYTLNNTAIATPRILVPLLENHQNADGSVNIPAKLQPYLAGASIIKGKQ